MYEYSNDEIIKGIKSVIKLEAEVENTKRELSSKKSSIGCYDDNINLTNNSVDIIKVISNLIKNNSINIELVLRECLNDNINVAFDYILFGHNIRLHPISQEEIDKTLDCAFNVVKQDSNKIEELASYHHLKLKDYHIKEIEQILFNRYQNKIKDAHDARRFLIYENYNDIGRCVAMNQFKKEPDEFIEMLTNEYRHLKKVNKDQRKQIFDEIGEEVFKEIKRSLHPMVYFCLFFKDFISNEHTITLIDRIVGYKNEEYAEQIINEFNLPNELIDRLNSILVFKKLS